MLKRNLHLLLFVFVAVLFSCSDKGVSEKSIFEKLSAEEIKEAAKVDTFFTTFYNKMRPQIDSLSDSLKTAFRELSWDRLFKFVNFTSDSAYWAPLDSNWTKEWQKKYSTSIAKADSTIAYWRTYLVEHPDVDPADIEMPVMAREYLSNEKEYTSLLEDNKDDLIKDDIDSTYVPRGYYINEKSEDIVMKKDKLSYEFAKELLKSRRQRN